MTAGSTLSGVNVKIGIGLPVAVPGRAAAETTQWAAQSERLGYHSLGTIDRLIYDNLEPLITLAAAAAVTTRVELFTAVLNAGWRNNAVLLAKQLSSIDQISGGRLTAGLALGAWPDDYEVSGVPFTGRGKAFDETLATMRRVWNGEVRSLSGPMPKMPEGRPGVLIGGFVPAAYARVARAGDGWMAPSFRNDILLSGSEAVRTEWTKAGRSGRPRVVVLRYFCCGPDAAAQMDAYIGAYYGDAASEYFDLVRADGLADDEHLRAELFHLADAGCDDVVLLPCSSSLDQPRLLAETLERAGIRGFEIVPQSVSVS
jgi:alkanesulfonate monooxygenase SsuD/methylene tetrahydromethanopterin reductase-like flavin-dependent oxidoreductase (luciferase family)